jgi:hypothetical protein
MAEEQLERLENSLRALRRRVDEVERAQHGEAQVLRLAAFASTLAGALLVLSATTWRTDGGDSEHVTTLWGLVPDGTSALLTLALVGILGIGTLAVFADDTAGPATHFTFAGFAALLAVGVLLVGRIEPHGFYDPDDVHSGPGRWLTLVAAVALGGLHASRGAQLRPVIRLRRRGSA